MAGQIALMVEKLLLQPPPIFEILSIYEFRDHVEPHDDELQKKLESEFDEAFGNALTQLRVHFGEPSNLDSPSIELPMNAFRSAVWLGAETAMSLVASHEDRECPYVLLVSVTPRKSK